jgi:RHS repeat-associated protein
MSLLATGTPKPRPFEIREGSATRKSETSHSALTYWSGIIRALVAVKGKKERKRVPPAITYTPDGEGRMNTVAASSGQNPVSGTSYNTASLPTAINLGSGTGDSDGFQYDTDNRMTQYQFKVSNTTLTGVVGWNSNSTVQTQNIADGFNSSDTQNCGYLYDDMTRLASANCGPAASQTFIYDPFGNINKSGSPYSFNPIYSATTNRISSVGGTTATYDSNGNVLNDSFHTYTWDADGHAISVDAGLSDAVSLTYDALGRMAEQNRSGSYTQIVYSPTGQKLALMSGQTLQKGMVPLTGNALAVYNPSGLLYYAHPDFLGTARLATTPNRTMYFDTAYAPFGETYASTGTLDPSYTGMMNDTGHRQDTAGGLYDFPVREYSTQGRWPSPDPLGKGSTCPMDPQTQNRYAYVRNNPMSYTDPTGALLYMFAEGGGGGWDPYFDPFSSWWVWVPYVPPIPFTSGGGGGTTEQPRPFPWPQVSPGIIAELALNFTGGSKLTPRQECLARCAGLCAGIFFCALLPPPLDVACAVETGAACVDCTLSCNVEHPN